MTEAKPEWYNDKVTGRVTNVYRPGDNIVVNVNGLRITIQDGATVTIPRAHVEAMEHAINVDWRVSPGQPSVQVNKPRFIFHEVQSVSMDKQTIELAHEMMAENDELRDKKKGGKKPKIGIVSEDAIVIDGKPIDVAMEANEEDDK